MFVELFADLPDMLKQRDDVRGQNLFDSTLISYGTKLRSGHGLRGCPAIYAGGGGKKLRKGEHLVLPEKIHRWPTIG